MMVYGAISCAQVSTSKEQILKQIIGILILILISLIGAVEPYRIHGTKERVAQTKSNIRFLTIAADSCGINLPEYPAILCYPDTRYYLCKFKVIFRHFLQKTTVYLEADWDTQKVTLYGSGRTIEDTVLQIDTLPEFSPRIIGFGSLLEAEWVYSQIKTQLDPRTLRRNILGIQKESDTVYTLDLSDPVSDSMESIQYNYVQFVKRDNSLCLTKKLLSCR